MQNSIDSQGRNRAGASLIFANLSHLIPMTAVLMTSADCFVRNQNMKNKHSTSSSAVSAADLRKCQGHGSPFMNINIQLKTCHFIYSDQKKNCMHPDFPNPQASGFPLTFSKLIRKRSLKRKIQKKGPKDRK